MTIQTHNCLIRSLHFPTETIEVRQTLFHIYLYLNVSKSSVTAHMWEAEGGEGASHVRCTTKLRTNIVPSIQLHCPPVAGSMCPLQHGVIQTSPGWHRNVNVSSSETSCLPVTCLVDLTVWVMASVWPCWLKPLCVLDSQTNSETAEEALKTISVQDKLYNQCSPNMKTDKWLQICLFAQRNMPSTLSLNTEFLF